MKVKDLFTIDNGIFDVWYDLPESGDIFKVLPVGVKHANTLVLLNYGNKTLSDIVNKDTYKNIIESIIDVNYNRWLRLAQALNVEYDVLKPVASTETHETSLNRQHDNDSTRFEAEKAFNDDDFTDSERTTGKDTDNITETTTTTVTKNLTVSANNVATVIQRELTLRETNLLLKIIGEIVYNITVDIYE